VIAAKKRPERGSEHAMVSNAEGSQAYRVCKLPPNINQAAAAKFMTLPAG
jgi:hypothetical protein